MSPFHGTQAIGAAKANHVLTFVTPIQVCNFFLFAFLLRCRLGLCSAQTFIARRLPQHFAKLLIQFFGSLLVVGGSALPIDSVGVLLAPVTLVMVGLARLNEVWLVIVHAHLRLDV